MHALSGVIEARQVAQCGHRGHRHSALAPAPGLEGLDDRRSAPGVPLRVECEFQTPSTFTLCSDGLDVFLKDHGVSRGGTPHRAEPAQVSGPPVGPTDRADIVPQHEGFAPQRGRLQSPAGVFSCPTQIPEGVIVDGRPRHGGEVPFAPG